jgi:hypothetical protein
MRQRPKHAWLILVVSTLLFLGCDFNNILDTDVSAIVSAPTLAIPLGYGNLSIADFLNDEDSSSIQIYQGGPDDGVLYLSYEQTLKTQEIRDLLTFPDKQISRGLNLPASVIPANGRVTLPAQNLSFDLDFNPEKFDEILFTQGTLRVTAQSNPLIPNLQFQASINFPTLTKDGQALTQTIQSGGAPQTISIADYKGVFDNNLFSTSVVITLISGASPTTIPPGTRFNVTLGFSNINFDYVLGFFGEQSVDLPEETLTIGAFENIFEGVNVSLASPRISFIVINEYGIPVTVFFDALEARNSTGSLSLETSPSSPVIAGFPTIRGDSAFTTVIVTNANELLNFAPTEFYYKVRAVINDGLTDGDNFSESDSELSVRMNVEVPFIGHASNIVISDTLEIDLSDVESSDIEEALIKVSAINELPLDASLQLYLLDENDILFDSLLDSSNGKNTIIVGADTDATGVPTTAGKLENEITISPAKINNLFEAKKIIIASRMQTADNPKDVKFRATDQLTIKLGLKAKLKLNVDL